MLVIPSPPAACGASSSELSPAGNDPFTTDSGQASDFESVLASAVQNQGTLVRPGTFVPDDQRPLARELWEEELSADTEGCLIQGEQTAWWLFQAVQLAVTDTPTHSTTVVSTQRESGITASLALPPTELPSAVVQTNPVCTEAALPNPSVENDVQDPLAAPDHTHERTATPTRRVELIAQPEAQATRTLPPGFMKQAVKRSDGGEQATAVSMPEATPRAITAPGTPAPAEQAGEGAQRPTGKPTPSVPDFQARSVSQATVGPETGDAPNSPIQLDDGDTVVVHAAKPEAVVVRGLRSEVHHEAVTSHLRGARAEPAGKVVVLGQTALTETRPTRPVVLSAVTRFAVEKEELHEDRPGADAPTFAATALDTPRTAAPTPRPEPRGPRPVVEQLVEQIVTRMEMARREGRTEFHLRLDPPNLGTVSVHLSFTENRLTAHLVAHEEATRQLLESQATTLQVRMNEAGVALGGFDVAYQGGDAREKWNQPRARPRVDHGFAHREPVVESGRWSFPARPGMGMIDVVA